MRCHRAGLDNERRAGHVRGPLHGIPLLVKDNIATLDNMQTTAGSLALYGSQVPADAPLIQDSVPPAQSFLANRTLASGQTSADDKRYPLAVGWSARGGRHEECLRPELHVMGFELRFRRRRGRELVRGGGWHRDRRFDHGPSAVENIFGLKPTLGLISQDGIVPISHQQDTAGPMARSVTDVAILLGVMQSPSAPCWAAAAKRLHAIPSTRLAPGQADRP